MQRLHDCMDAGGRTTQGAVVEKQISAHAVVGNCFLRYSTSCIPAVVFFKEGSEQSAFHNNQLRKVISYQSLRRHPKGADAWRSSDRWFFSMRLPRAITSPGNLIFQTVLSRAAQRIRRILAAWLVAFVVDVADVSKLFAAQFVGLGETADIGRLFRGQPEQMEIL
jgi:hypothetical protein